MAPPGLGDPAAPPEALDGNDRGRSPSPYPPRDGSLRTRVASAGEDRTALSRPMTPPIHQSSVYAFRDPAQADRRYAAGGAVYARDGLPNARALERAVADLEGAEDAHAVASGMGAIALTLLAHLSGGDHVVASAACYCETQALLTRELSRFGVASTLVDLDDPFAFAAAFTPRTRIVIAETIANPGMNVADLPRLSEVAHAAGALLLVDNTFATPILCRPLDHGADLVVHSASKFLGGHHDLVAGVVAGRDAEIGQIRRAGHLFGPTLGALDAWLALRGIKTLAPRVAWMSESAARIAAMLAGHPAVRAVRYPGLPGPDPARAALVRRLLPDGAGAMLAFELAAGPDAADALLRALQLIAFAPSLGGTTTTACYPPRFSPWDDAAPETVWSGSATIRLSVGLESAPDLIADLKQGLDLILDEHWDHRAAGSHARPGQEGFYQI